MAPLTNGHHTYKHAEQHALPALVSSTIFKSNRSNHINRSLTMHRVTVTIKNNAASPLLFDRQWFDHGSVDGYVPHTIAAKSQVVIECSGGIPGTSGWLKYTYNGAPFYFCFSNPLVGRNGIEFGCSTSAWDGMGGQYFPGSRAVAGTGTDWLTAIIQSTGGDINNASFSVQYCDVGVVTPANIELNDVVATFNNVSNSASRTYYKCPAGIPPATLMQSHFKGIARFADKLIFTHTNLLVTESNGKYLIAQAPGGATQAGVNRIYDTMHDGWQHPCSSQACGSFMAMGIQKSEGGDGSKHSEIEILDIRRAQVNQPLNPITTIEHPTDGVNGVAMTKEHGPDGCYLVAGINGQVLTLYRSSSSNLLAPGLSFFEFDSIADFPESGAGLALVTQSDGSIYIITLNADDDGNNNTMGLYAITYQAGVASSFAIHTDPNIPRRAMPIQDKSDVTALIPEYAALSITIDPEIKIALTALAVMDAAKSNLFNNSFRWGKGLAITSSENIEVYASDRDALPLSQVVEPSTDHDFSVLTWSSRPFGAEYMTTNKCLLLNDKLISQNGQYYAVQQGDGNFCVYNAGSQWQWGSQATGPIGPYFTAMQGDGNLCTYKGGGPEDNQGFLWNSGTPTTPGDFFLIMQNDGNLCIYRGTGPSDNQGFVWGWKNI